MTASIDRSIADRGYENALRLLWKGGLPDFELWKPEALERFAEAFVDCEFDPAWLEKFNQDLKQFFGSDFVSATQDSFTDEQRDFYARGDEPMVCITVNRQSDHSAQLIIYASGMIKPVPAFNFFF